MYQEANLLPEGIKNVGQVTAMHSGGAGLVSTAADYAKFMNFLLRRSDDNALSLSQASFDLMLTELAKKKVTIRTAIKNWVYKGLYHFGK